MTYVIDNTPLWRPDPATVGETRMAMFMQATGHGRYGDLWQWSVNRPEAFWPTLWNFCGAVGEQGEAVLENGERMPGATWFPQARLNYAENLLKNRDAVGLDVVATAKLAETDLTLTNRWEVVATDEKMLGDRVVTNLGIGGKMVPGNGTGGTLVLRCEDGDLYLDAMSAIWVPKQGDVWVLERYFNHEFAVGFRSHAEALAWYACAAVAPYQVVMDRPTWSRLDA